MSDRIKKVEPEMFQFSLLVNDGWVNITSSPIVIFHRQGDSVHSLKLLWQWENIFLCLVKSMHLVHLVVLKTNNQILQTTITDYIQ